MPHELLNLALNVIMISGLTAVLGWMIRRARRDARRKRFVADVVANHYNPPDLADVVEAVAKSQRPLDSMELSKTLIEVRHRLGRACPDPDTVFIAGYLDGMQYRPGPDGRPPLRSV